MYYLGDEDALEEELDFKELIFNSSWNEGAIRDKVLAEMAEYIIQDIKPGERLK